MTDLTLTAKFRQLMTICFLFFFLNLESFAQQAKPTISLYVSNEDEKEYVEMQPGEKKVTQAPCEITCNANLDYDEDEFDKVVSEWKIFRADDGETKPLLDRYDEDVTYTLTESGGYSVKFYATFINTVNDNTVEFETETPFSIVISESKLTCTDGLSPNEDLINDKLVIECQSLVKVDGCIMNRWGKVLHTFNIANIADGWDGKYNGNYVKDGAYLLYIDAVGSDGLHYKIKKVINVIKGYKEDADSTPTP